jgi:AhpD family alkylhydroperoxidase
VVSIFFELLRQKFVVVHRSHFLVLFRHGNDEGNPASVTDRERRIIMTQASGVPKARINNPGMVIPEAVPAILNLLKATKSGGVPEKTMELVHLRASQINGCSFCVDMGARNAKKAGETDERLYVVAAWRETPYFTEAERAALALAEAATRLSDRPDPVPDEVWNAAAEHYDEKQLASLVLMIGITNLFNRINVSTRQPAGQWPSAAEAQKWAEKSATAR